MVVDISLNSEDPDAGLEFPIYIYPPCTVRPSTVRCTSHSRHSVSPRLGSAVHTPHARESLHHPLCISHTRSWVASWRSLECARVSSFGGSIACLKTHTLLTPHKPLNQHLHLRVAVDPPYLCACKQRHIKPLNAWIS